MIARAYPLARDNVTGHSLDTLSTDNTVQHFVYTTACAGKKQSKKIPTLANLKVQTIFKGAILEM